MKVVYMGTPDFAVPALCRICDDGHEIPLVVTRPDARANRGKKIQLSPVKEEALKRNLEVEQPEKIRGNDAFIKKLKDIEPEVIVVAAYGMILPSEVLMIPPKGCLNIHGSLLPRFRGAAPIQAAILSGDEETGITIMKMDEGLDTGDMLLKRSTAIDRKTGRQLHDELAKMGAELIGEALDRLDELEPQRQDDDLSTYAPMISKKDGRIDFTQSAEELERRIRAYDPWPGSFTAYGDKIMKLWSAEVIPGDDDARPGTVIGSGADGIDISCGKGILRLTRLQMPGRKRVTAEEYLRGNTIETGTVLG